MGTRWAGLGTVLVLSVLAVSPSGAAFLESPAPQAVVSGIGFISGWKCDAGNITVRIDGGEPIAVAMDQPRADTQSICGTPNNGFIQQINWEHVGGGSMRPSPMTTAWSSGGLRLPWARPVRSS